MSKINFHSHHIRTLGLLLMVAVITWAGSFAYLFLLDAPLDFLVRVTEQQDRWSSHFTPEQGPRILVTGGSSCIFSIDAEMATEKFHVPVVNAGDVASVGSYGVMLMTSRLVRPGDTVVVAIEPDLFESPIIYAKDALQLLLRRTEWHAIMHSEEITGQAVPLDLLFFSARPGLDNFAAFLGRIILRAPRRDAEIRTGGFSVINMHPALPFNIVPLELTISPENRALLLHLKAWAADRKVRLVYSLPWYYVGKSYASDARIRFARFLSRMIQYMPVVRDDDFSVVTDPSIFSDNKWHLSEKGAELRTTELLTHLLAGEFWTPEDLDKAQADLTKK